MSTALFPQVRVFQAGTGGYRAFRIPVIQALSDGTLLAFAEARRYTLADPGGEGQEIHLVCKRSTDGGLTWSHMQVIEAPGLYWSAANPVAVTDRVTGRTWVIYLRCRPNADSCSARPGTDDIRMLARWTEDGGLTWSEPLDLTAASRDMTDPEWGCTVPGPGGAIQDRQGRLIVPCWKNKPRRGFAIFSADHGSTWMRGAPVPGQVSGNEDQLVELGDGRLLLDFRQDADEEHRWFAESMDGGRTWNEPRPGLAVTRVACAIQRWTLAAAGADRDRIAWTGPAGPGRRDLVVRVSFDEGRSFGAPRLINSGPAAYSDLTVLPDGALGVFWEGGEAGPYESLSFTRLTLMFMEAER